MALSRLVDQWLLEDAAQRFVAAVSVGIVVAPVLDLDYVEDSRAEVDMNVVMTAAAKLVEVQGTAEGAPFEPGFAGRAARARRGRHRGTRDRGPRDRKCGRFPPMRAVLAPGT